MGLFNETTTDSTGKNRLKLSNREHMRNVCVVLIVSIIIFFLFDVGELVFTQLGAIFLENSFGIFKKKLVRGVDETLQVDANVPETVYMRFESIESYE